MDKEIYKRQLESLKQEKQRETDRHNNAISDLDKRKRSENEQHSRKIQSINDRINQLKNSNLVSSNESYNLDYNIEDLINILKNLVDGIQ